MNRILISQLALATFLSALMFPYVFPVKAAPIRKAPRAHSPIQVLGQREDGTVGSTNWAGYAALGTDVTDVRGSWIVPAVDCSDSSANHYAAFWAGIDGYSSSTVEQTGTDSDCVKGQPSYYAWFEFYPGPSFNVVDFTVTPGDSIAAEVSYDSTSQLFTAHLQDSTSGQSFKVSSAVPNAKRSSAEWIVEAPANGANKILPLAQFGTVFLGHYYTGIAKTNYATISGTTTAIGEFAKVSDIVMVKKDGTIKALPSPLSSNGSSFAATRE